MNNKTRAFNESVLTGTLTAVYAWFIFAVSYSYIGLKEPGCCSGFMGGGEVSRIQFVIETAIVSMAASEAVTIIIFSGFLTFLLLWLLKSLPASIAWLIPTILILCSLIYAVSVYIVLYLDPLALSNARSQFFSVLLPLSSALTVLWGWYIRRLVKGSNLVNK